MTDAEKALWRIVHVGELAALNWRRQSPFRGYVLDFVSHAARLVIEIDGVHHAEPKHQDHDARRTELLKSQGYQVLRFWNHEVLHHDDAVWVSIHSTALQTSAAPRMSRWRIKHSSASPSMGEAVAKRLEGVIARTAKVQPLEATPATSRATPPPSSLRDDSSPIEGEQGAHFGGR